MRILTSDRLFRRNVGGNTTYARSVYDGLELAGHEHVLRSPSSERRSSATYAVWEGVVLPRHAGAYGVDLLHFPGDTGALLSSAVPVVATIHGCASLHVEGVRNWRQETIWRARVARLSRLATRVITVSESSAEDLVAAFGVAREKIRVIPHGVDRRTFRPLTAQEVSERLERLDLPRRFVLYVGNLEPRKNIPALVAAMGDARIRRAGVDLVVVGRPAWNASAIVRLVEATPFVTYLGPVERRLLPALLARCEAFAFPSLYEGFGLPVLEAMACGAPVVATMRGALQEVGRDAVMYAASPAARDVAESLAHILDDERARVALREAGPARAAVFNWSDSVRRHEHVFAEAIEEHCA